VETGREIALCSPRLEPLREEASSHPKAKTWFERLCPDYCSQCGPYSAKYPRHPCSTGAGSLSPLGLLDHIPRIGATFVLAQHLSLSVLSGPWPPDQNAAAQLVIAAIRAERSILNLLGGVRTASANASTGHALFSPISSLEFRSMHKGVHWPWLEIQQAHSKGVHSLPVYKSLLLKAIIPLHCRTYLRADLRAV
jgi:hypothetical protein